MIFPALAVSSAAWKTKTTPAEFDAGEDWTKHDRRGFGWGNQQVGDAADFQPAQDKAHRRLEAALQILGMVLATKSGICAESSAGSGFESIMRVKHLRKVSLPVTVQKSHSRTPPRRNPFENLDDENWPHVIIAGR